MSQSLGNSHRDRRVEGSLSVPREQNGNFSGREHARHLLRPSYDPRGGLQESGGRKQVEERKDGSPAGRNSVGKGVDVGGRTMGRGGLTTEAAAGGGEPWTWGNCPHRDRGRGLTIKPGGPRGPWMPLKPMSPGGPWGRQEKAVCVWWPLAEAPAALSPLGSGQFLPPCQGRSCLRGPRNSHKSPQLLSRY